jgi:sulfane dehydrogenase subunit SoxC
VVPQSRSFDEAGNIQPTRAELFAERGDPATNPPVTALPMEHINAIANRAIDARGETRHVYT